MQVVIQGSLGTMCMLSKKQLRVLGLRRKGVEFSEMRKYGLSRSTAHDAYRRAERNLERIMKTIDCVADRSYGLAATVRSSIQLASPSRLTRTVMPAALAQILEKRKSR